MTKRFSPKASTYTARLCTVQKEILELKKKLALLETEERSLNAFCRPYFDLGKTEVDYGNTRIEVSYSETERTYLDQIKARSILTKLGAKVPEFKTPVITFRVKEAK